LKATLTKEETDLAAFRLPKALRSEARGKCEIEDITFSQLMRRAVRRELGLPLPVEKNSK
jgi:hypothetical protein